MAIVMDARPGGGSAPDRSLSPSLATVLGVLGLVFTVVAGADVLLSWVPPQLGDREWEFGTITTSMNGMLAVTLGLGLVVVWLREDGPRWSLLVMSIVFALMALAILGAAVLYWTNVPLALRAVEPGPIRLGLMKAVAKTGVQSAAYPVLYLYLAWAAHRWRKA